MRTRAKRAGVTLLAAGLLLASCAVAQPAPAPPAPSARSVPPLAINAPPPAVVRDQALIQALERAAQKLVADGKIVPLADLQRQLDRKGCSLPLASPSTQKLTPGQIYDQCRRSVLVLGGIHKCDRCPRWHAAPCCAFVLTASGAVATNYHVVADKSYHSLIAMASDGAVFPVKEVLAASAEDDAAILQLDLQGAVLPPLALSPGAPVGTPVCVISHPGGHFYALTCGIVSRYSERMKGGKSATLMDITADFARGSSGAPVLDDRGAVVGLVASTESLYYTVTDGKKDNLQMVFKHCVPAESILKLIRP